MLELDLPPNPTAGQIKTKRDALDREIARQVMTLLIVRPRVNEDLSAFAKRADDRTVGKPNREVIWIKDARIFSQGQEAQLFDSHDDACAVVLERRKDQPVEWLPSDASRDEIEQAFSKGGV
jgi:hypothetical protein